MQFREITRTVDISGDIGEYLTRTGRGAAHEAAAAPDQRGILRADGALRRGLGAANRHLHRPHLPALHSPPPRGGQLCHVLVAQGPLWYLPSAAPPPSRPVGKLSNIVFFPPLSAADILLDVKKSLREQSVIYDGLLLLVVNQGPHISSYTFKFLIYRLFLRRFLRIGLIDSRRQAGPARPDGSRRGGVQDQHMGGAGEPSHCTSLSLSLKIFMSQ